MMEPVSERVTVANLGVWGEVPEHGSSFRCWLRVSHGLFGPDLKTGQSSRVDRKQSLEWLLVVIHLSCFLCFFCVFHKGNK